MKNIQMRVVNKTKLVVSLTGCSEEKSLYGGGTTMLMMKFCFKKKIVIRSFGRVCYNRCWPPAVDWDGDFNGRFYVRCCEQELLVLEVHDFQNNMGKDLVLDVLEDWFVYAFVDPMSNTNNITWFRGQPCNVGELMVDQRIWSDKGFKRGNMMNLETAIVNNTDLELKFIDWYQEMSWKAGEFGGSDIRVPAHWRKTICSGNFARARERRPLKGYRIGVWSGQHCLVELCNQDFQKNKGKDLVFDMVDGTLYYYFMYPMAIPPRLIFRNRIEQLPVPLTLLKQLDKREVHDEECNSFITKVVNKTDSLLTLRNYVKYESDRYPAEYCEDIYGQMNVRVRKGGSMIICPGFFFRKARIRHDIFYRRRWREMHVLRDGQVMLVLNSHHFHNTQGKRLIFDDIQGTLTFAFVTPTHSRLTSFFNNY